METPKLSVGKRILLYFDELSYVLIVFAIISSIAIGLTPLSKHHIGFLYSVLFPVVAVIWMVKVERKMAQKRKSSYLYEVTNKRYHDILQNKHIFEHSENSKISHMLNVLKKEKMIAYYKHHNSVQKRLFELYNADFIECLEQYANTNTSLQKELYPTFKDSLDSMHKLVEQIWETVRNEEEQMKQQEKRDITRKLKNIHEKYVKEIAKNE